MAQRRTQVSATILDDDGYAFVVFKGNPQDVADACAMYVLNIGNPLGGDPLIDLMKRRDGKDEEAG